MHVTMLSTLLKLHRQLDIFSPIKLQIGQMRNMNVEPAIPLETGTVWHSFVLRMPEFFYSPICAARPEDGSAPAEVAAQASTAKAVQDVQPGLSARRDEPAAAESGAAGEAEAANEQWMKEVEDAAESVADLLDHPDDESRQQVLEAEVAKLIREREQQIDEIEYTGYDAADPEGPVRQREEAERWRQAQKAAQKDVEDAMEASKKAQSDPNGPWMRAQQELKAKLADPKQAHQAMMDDMMAKDPERRHEPGHGQAKSLLAARHLREKWARGAFAAATVGSISGGEPSSQHDRRSVGPNIHPATHLEAISRALENRRTLRSSDPGK